MSCAVGLAVLDVIENEDLRGNAIKVGSTLKKLLTNLHSKHEIVGDVRGVGLFVGLELVTDRELKTPATKTAAYVANRLKDDHIFVSTDGPWDNVLKFKPPMCFSMDDAYQVTQAIDRILTDIKTMNLKLEKDDI